MKTVPTLVEGGGHSALAVRRSGLLARTHARTTRVTLFIPANGIRMRRHVRAQVTHAPASSCASIADTARQWLVRGGFVPPHWRLGRRALRAVAAPVAHCLSDFRVASAVLETLRLRNSHTVTVTVPGGMPCDCGQRVYRETGNFKGTRGVAILGITGESVFVYWCRW